MKIEVVFAGMVIIFGIYIVPSSCYSPQIDRNIYYTTKRLRLHPVIREILGSINADDQDVHVRSDNLTFSLRGKHSEYLRINSMGVIFLWSELPKEITYLQFTAVVKDSVGNMDSQEFSISWCTCT